MYGIVFLSTPTRSVKKCTGCGSSNPRRPKTGGALEGPAFFFMHVMHVFMHVKSGNLKNMHVEKSRYGLNHAGEYQKRTEMGFSDEK